MDASALFFKVAVDTARPSGKMDNDTEQISFRIDAALKKKFELKLTHDDRTQTGFLRAVIHSYVHGAPAPQEVLPDGLTEKDLPLLLAIKEYLDTPTDDPLINATKDAFKDVLLKKRKK